MMRRTSEEGVATPRADNDDDASSLARIAHFLCYFFGLVALVLNASLIAPTSFLDTTLQW